MKRPVLLRRALRCAPCRTTALSVEPLEVRRLLASTPQIIQDINPGAGNSTPLFPGPTFAEVNGLVYFAATTPTQGVELWRTNGTASGTWLVRDINPGVVSSQPMYLTNVGGTLYFAANNAASGIELWKSNGTSSGTLLVADIEAGVGFSLPRQLINVGGTLFFSADTSLNGRELWKSDGTSSGTALVRDVFPLSSDGISDNQPMAVLGGAVYFAANDGPGGVELWKSDGTSVGTVLVRDINPGAGSSSPNSLATVNGAIWMAANDGTRGDELWRSNGTSAGTILIKSIRPGINSSRPTGFTNVNGTIFFLANDGSNGYELWKTGGANSNTALVADINPGPSSSSNPFANLPFLPQNLGGTLVFAADNGATGLELFRSDGTSAGTNLIVDLWPGNIGSLADIPLFPPLVVSAAGKLYFSADDGQTGEEVWQTDGTAPGTVQTADTNPGAANFNPQGFTVANGQVIGWGVFPGQGTEPWSLNPADSLLAASMTGQANPFRGETASYTVSASGPAVNPTDTVTYYLDWDSNGTIDQTVSGLASGTTVAHAYSASDSVAASVQVQFGALVSSPTLYGITVTDYVVRPRPGAPGVNDLFWGGTPGLDAAFFYYNSGPTTTVQIFTWVENGAGSNETIGVPNVTGQVYVYGYDTADTLVAEFLQFQQANIYGGGGNDVLVGGTLGDVLDGGDGDDILLGGDQVTDGGDMLTGGAGKDLLFGHRGADVLHGNAGEDLLVADRVEFGADLPTAVFSIQSEWLSGRSYAERIANISGTGTGPRSNGNFFLQPGATVINDGAIDLLFGGSEQDWFLLDLSQDLLGDLFGGETATDT